MYFSVFVLKRRNIFENNYTNRIMRTYSPVIIIGMKESGADDVAKILEFSGLFMGHTKNINSESVFFHDTNACVLRKFSSGRENPLPVVMKLLDLKIRQKFVEYAEELLSSTSVVSFLGWPKYFVYRSPKQLNLPWGWYDSISMITLPIWLDIFPNAKIIYVYRNQVDVIRLITTKRAKRISELKASRDKWFKFIYWYYLLTKYVPDKSLVEMRCSSPEEAQSLWKEYNSIPLAYSQYLDSKKFMQLSYDEFVKFGEHGLREIIDFCQLEYNEYNLKGAVNFLNALQS